ncbi:hypothetical protein ASE01_09195 [Nocardioides sp. Root190]|uniref:hypothetical protein n=1 Tax=Nocardioides sp. Root190 TaxID=1736488 RepID=UPI00070201D4|nr:hypothetical protein [Nocardioides sp. Root190]KRB76935.1 hypothetical protein ASE01_09195 [Nocardioides sp. Root190]
MNQPPPGPPPPPYAPGWPPPAGPTPPRRRTGLTLVLLAVGLVVVLGVIAVVALVVRGDDGPGSGGDGGDDSARATSCEVYADVVMSSELWAATEFDPDKLQEMYDAALADITDDEIATVVGEEATVVVSYYRDLEEWKQSVDEALARGEYPESAIPAEISDQRGELTRAQGAVAEACGDDLPGRLDDPAPSITAPTLESPSPGPLGGE